MRIVRIIIYSVFTLVACRGTQPAPSSENIDDNNSNNTEVTSSSPNESFQNWNGDSDQILFIN